MTKSIYDILSTYEHSIDTEATFINSIEHVRDQVNTINEEHNTPIMHYCSVHLNSGISSFVIRTLITRFQADINTKVHGRIPLSMLLADQDHRNLLNNIEIIELLYKYTKTLPILTVGSPKIITDILLKLPLSSPATDYTSLQDKIHMLSKEMGYNKLSSILFDIKNELSDGLFSIDTPERIKLVLDFMQWIQGNNMPVEPLLLQAIEMNKILIVNKILELYPINLDTNPNPMMINPAKIDVSAHNALLNNPNIISITQIISNQIDKNIYDYKSTNIMVICGTVIDINNLIEENTYTKFIRYANSIIFNNVNTERDTIDHNTIAQSFGFNNNIFHYLALLIDFDHAPFIQHNTDVTLLFQQNAFGQTPIKIAILRNNKSFIECIKPILSRQEKSLYAIDYHKNTVGHILAIKPLNKSDLQWILKAFEQLIDTKSILDTTNRLGQSPIHLAFLTNNIEFIQWWENQGGSFDVIDNTQKTLWHYFIQSQVIDNNVNALDIQYIHNKLNEKIAHMVSYEDADGTIPIYLALTSPLALELLLQDYGDNINYQHRDKAGNTISHILSTNFVKHHHRTGNYIGNIHNKVVTLLIPYAVKMQENYNILNNDNQYPINIVEQRLDNKLSLWLHTHVGHDILKAVSESLELPFNTANSYMTTFSSSEVPIRKFRIKVDNTQVFLDNKLIFFSPSVVLKAYEVNTLYQRTIDIIRALSFEIAYSHETQSNDNIMQFLISIDPLGLDAQFTVLHILKILDNRIVKNICNTPNNLGEYLVHTVVSYDRDIILQYLLSIDPQILSQTTQPFTYDTASVILYPCDYIILLQTNKVRAVIKEFKSKNPDYKLISNIRSIFPNLNMYEQIIDNYFLGEIGDQDEIALQYSLLSIHNTFVIKLQEDITRNSNHHYFPILSSYIPHLRNQYLSLIYKDDYDEIYGLNYLKEYLLWYKKNKEHPPKFLSFLDNSHASSLVLFKDDQKQFRVLIHDSIPEAEEYKRRIDNIKQVLYMHLNIDDKNIHTLYVPQQAIDEMNCVLWTIANLQLIEHYLLKRTTNCISCLPLLYRRQMIPWKDHDKTLQEIQLILATSSEPLVKFLEQEISKCHQYSCKIQESFIDFQKLLGILASNPSNTLDDRDKQEAHNRRLPLLKEDIESITDIYYTNIYKIYTIDQEYYNSDYGLIILEGTKNDNKIFKEQIRTFLDRILLPPTADCDKNLLLSRIFIINKGSTHWVTLVIAAKTKSVKIYFADSRADSMPEYIKIIIKSALFPYYKDLDMNEQIVDTQQLDDNYNSGLWAMKNADYIMNACVHNQDISKLKSIIKGNIEKDRQQIIQQRKVLNMQHISSHPQTLTLQELEDQINNMGITPHQMISCTHSSIIPSNRKKRTICNEEQNTAPMVDDILSQFAIPENDKIDMQMYFNIVCLAALQDETDDKKSKIHNTLRYINGMYDIFSEGPENHSAREQAIINRYYQNVNEPGLLSTIKNQLFSRAQYLQDQDDSVIFYNDHCSIIVSHENAYYLLYSQNYFYNTVFKTKDGVTVDDIQKFVELFFAFYSVNAPGYHMFFLDDNQYTKDVLSKLEKDDIWNNDYTIQSNLELLLESKDSKIENIPISIIRTIFFIDNQMPDLRLLHDDFFSTNLKRISLRIDQIHKAFLSLDTEQLKALKILIKKYDFPYDQTYFDKINHTKHKHTKELISLYHIQMQHKLKHIEELTLRDIEELTWEILDQFMKLSDISSELRASSLQNMRTIYSTFAHYTKLHAHKITQVSFFIPDLIKTFNYDQYIPLLQSLGILSADMKASKYMVQLYRKVIERMEPHLDPNILKAINSIPGLKDALHDGLEEAVQNPIFKILTLKSLTQLLHKVSTMDPKTTEYEIMNHKLNEEWTTIGFMGLELCNIEMTPAWFALMIERLRYDGHQISLLHHLDIPAWQETLIGLGFYQDKVDYMIEESNLINYNLQLLDAATKHFVHDQTHTSTGLYIIKIPHFLKERIWYAINAEQVPQAIQNTLINKGIKELSYAQNPPIMIPPTFSRPNSAIAIENNYRIEYYDHKNCKYSINKYEASGSNTTIIFREYTKQEYRQSGPKDDVFADAIILPSNTWLRLPPKVYCKISFLNLWCDEPQQFFVIRDTGDSALYYSNKNIDQTLLLQKNISYVFDPREGNMSITFTQDVIKKLNQNTEWYLTVFVQQKSYPAILSFQAECPQALFMLHDANNLIILKYFILNNQSPFILDDNANVRYITAATVQIPYSQTTYHKTIISGTSKNISLDSTDNIKSHHSIILSSKNKDKISIYLDPITYHIGDKLYLSDKDISIDNVLGHSNQSTIVFTGHNDQKFRLTLLGDIIVNDLSHISLRVLGHYQSKSSVYSKCYDVTMSYTEYNLYVQDFSSVFNTMYRLTHDNGTIYIEFTDTNNVQYQLYRQKSAGHRVVVDSDVPGVTLQIASAFNILELYNKSKLQYTFYTVHYDEIFQYNSNCIIQKIFIKSNTSFEPTNVIQNIQNSSNFNDYSFLLSMNGSIILFFLNGHEWYNIWPLRRDITINNINYKITEDGICHIPSENTNNNGHNYLLEYVDSNSYSSKHSRIPSCNHETARVKAHAKRSISHADYTYSHPIGISYFDGQDVNNDTKILHNYSDNTLSQATNECSALIPFGYIIVNSMRATLSQILTHIKNYYDPILNQASRQISSVEEDIKIDNIISDTEELNNSIKQPKVVEEISSDANSNGAAKMLNDHTDFVVNKNDGTSNIIDNLQLGYNSHNGSTQGITTFDINGTLMLGQIFAYKFCGKNKLFKNTCYLSPTQERNIILEQVSSEVLSMCNDFTNDTNTFNYNDYCDNTPSCYQDLWQDNL